MSPSQTAIFHGDVIHKIGGIQCELFDEVTLENMFLQASQPLEVEIIETSALRKAKMT